eukprot:PITA_16060
MGWKIQQMDVKTTFLNGMIEEEVYIENPEGFETFNKESHVCRLKRALYRLKQAPCAWYTGINSYFIELIKSYKEDLIGEVKMKDLGLMHYFLEMEVCKGYEKLFFSQGKFSNEILKKFHMESSKPMNTPLAGNWTKEDATSDEVVEVTIYRKLVGSLMYLVNTRLDICYAVNQLSQEMVKLTKLYWKASKHVLRYLRDSTQYGLW